MSLQKRALFCTLLLTLYSNKAHSSQNTIYSGTYQPRYTNFDCFGITELILSLQYMGQLQQQQYQQIPPTPKHATHVQKKLTPKIEKKNRKKTKNLISLQPMGQLQQQEQYQQLPSTPKHVTYEQEEPATKIKKKNTKSTKKLMLSLQPMSQLQQQEQYEQLPSTPKHVTFLAEKKVDRERNILTGTDNTWREEIDPKFKKLTVAIANKPRLPIRITSVHQVPHVDSTASKNLTCNPITDGVSLSK